MAQQDDRLLWLGGVAFGAAAIGGLFWYLNKTKSVTVQATAGAMSIVVPRGQSLTVTLPQGATWTATLTNLVSSGVSGNVSGGSSSAPLVIANVNGGGTLSLAWQDASGAPQVTQLSVATS